MNIKVTSEGREGVWLADRDSLKAWVVAQDFEAIHNFSNVGPLLLGADHEVGSVLADIDAAEKVAVLTGESLRGNMNHALALIMKDGHMGLSSRLEMFDIGDVTENDLDIE